MRAAPSLRACLVHAWLVVGAGEEAGAEGGRASTKRARDDLEQGDEEEEPAEDEEQDEALVEGKQRFRGVRGRAWVHGCLLGVVACDMRVCLAVAS